MLLDQYTESSLATRGFDLAYSLEKTKENRLVKETEQRTKQAQNNPPFSHCRGQHTLLPLAARPPPPGSALGDGELIHTGWVRIKEERVL